MQLPIKIDRSVALSLQLQIVEQFKLLIRSGRLSAGDPIPSSRLLSQQLNVSRNTVSGAYTHLMEEGYFDTQQGHGTYVSKVLPESTLIPKSKWPPPSDSRAHLANLPLPYTARGLSGLHSSTRIAMPYDFALGGRDSRLFPETAWRRVVTECLGGTSVRLSGYQDPQGLAELRQQIATFLGATRGMSVSPEQILIVAGCQQGMAIAAHLLVGNGTPTAVEAPCYRGAVFLFESYGARIIPAPVDSEGIQVNLLPEEEVRLLYTTPSHQFPTGVTMSEARRIELIEWSRRTGSYLLEVDYDADVRYENAPLPSIYALDDYGATIYISSVSRVLGPGLRIGYMVVPESLQESAIKVKSILDNGLPWLEQASLAQFMREESFLQHLKRMRKVQRGRRDVLFNVLQRFFTGGFVSGEENGSHVVWHIPDYLPPAAEIQSTAAEQGIGVYPLEDSPTWFNDALPDYDRVLLLGYTMLSESEIQTAVERLATVLGVSAEDGHG